MDQKLYLNPADPWSFEGHEDSAKYTNDCKVQDSEQYNYVHAYKYGPAKGNADFPDGYVIVWGASDQSFNGIYHSNIYGSGIYTGPYMKRCKNNDDQTGYFLKFSRMKGIKTVPQLSKYFEYDEEDYWWDYGDDNRWTQSPTNDEEMANLRWDLIKNTKKRLLNGENLSFIPQKNNETSKKVLKHLQKPQKIEKNNESSKKVPKHLQKHYETLMNTETFPYKYIYKWDDKLKKLVSENNDFAYCAFIRDFAFDEHLYPQLAKCIPKNYDYKRKREIKTKLLILNEYFNEITHLGQVVLSFLDLKDTCVHKCITHIICMTEGKNNYSYTQRFVCDACESIIHMPENDNINEQLLFVCRVRRSFGMETNGRKSSHTPHLHSFKIRKWISDERFNGMTHENATDKAIDIYNTDEITNMIDSNKIGTILKGERVYVYWKTKIGIAKDMMAVRTKIGIIGYCVLFDPPLYDTSTRDFKKLLVSFSEIEKFVVDNNIIVSYVRVDDGENPIWRLRRTLRGLFYIQSP